MICLLSKLLLFTFVATVIGSEEIYYEDYVYSEIGDEVSSDDEEYLVTHLKPSFTSKGQVFSVEVGGEITFPCQVENQGDQVLMFKYFDPNGEHLLLFVGDQALRPKIKMVKEGNSFTLSNVRRNHAGNYVCRIETSPAIEVNHTLNVEYQAKVKRVSEEVQHVVQGESVTLECRADGNPPAAISWSRQKGHLPSGAQSEEGLSITLENVDRHVEGTYICTASNGLGQPSSASMTVIVKYPPEIITEQAILHTGEGDEAKLVCIVHGRPTPKVTWMRGGHSINTDRHLSTHDGLHRHTLTVKQVKEEDFGNYTCIAESNLGRVNSSLRLTGLPRMPRLTSSPAGGEKRSYTLTWETESHTPVIMYRLQYRKRKESQESHSTGQWKIQLYSTSPSSNPNGPAVAPLSAGPLKYMTHAITDLDPATDYEATVAVENKFGWSRDSEIFLFNTRKEVAVGQSASGGGTSRGAFTLLVVLLLSRPLLS
ncbi:limbic system-associated membrane protein-like isoform X2 [Portunus trituberculatus]|uniref:limbic system-associated membrane protein-like isoform X2 n=1 Tax=Portunus trituberculatus TaxID=210409 RepID=UPI001E1D0F5E|nr:limbic system-associated membrane protein-like isoform X2 [Portunus trituberculatus]